MRYHILLQNLKTSITSTPAFIQCFHSCMSFRIFQFATTKIRDNRKRARLCDLILGAIVDTRVFGESIV